MPITCSPDVQTSGKSRPATVAARNPETSCSCVSVPSAKKVSIKVSSASATISISCSRAIFASSAIAAGTSPSVILPLLSAANVTAFIRTRSTTPVKFRSSPIGSWIGTISRAQSRCSDSRVRSRLARSRSSRLTATIRGRFSAAASDHSFSVWTSTPATASTTTRAPSTTRRAERASVRKLANPGVSMRLILVFCHSAWARLDASVCLRAMASSSKSVTVEPSSTFPRRLTAAAANSMAETSWVLPHPPWPTTATLRMLAASYTFIWGNPPHRPAGPWRNEIRLRIIVTGLRRRKAGRRLAGAFTAEPPRRKQSSDIYVVRNYHIDKFVLTRL